MPDFRFRISYSDRFETACRNSLVLQRGLAVDNQIHQYHQAGHLTAILKKKKKKKKEEEEEEESVEMSSLCLALNSVIEPLTSSATRQWRQRLDSIKLVISDSFVVLEQRKTKRKGRIPGSRQRMPTTFWPALGGFKAREQYDRSGLSAWVDLNFCVHSTPPWAPY